MNSGIVFRGVDHLVRRVETMQAQIARNKDRAAKAAANALKIAVKREAPTGKHSGRHHVKPSVRVRKVPGGYRVKPESRLAHLVIRGHQPPKREIVPRRAQSLHFFAGGGEVFSMSSRGGSQGANPFVDKAAILMKPEAKRVAGAVLFHDMPDPNEG